MTDRPKNSMCNCHYVSLRNIRVFVSSPFYVSVFEMAPFLPVYQPKFCIFLSLPGTKLYLAKSTYLESDLAKRTRNNMQVAEKKMMKGQNAIRRKYRL